MFDVQNLAVSSSVERELLMANFPTPNLENKFFADFHKNNQRLLDIDQKLVVNFCKLIRNVCDWQILIFLNLPFLPAELETVSMNRSKI
ncbi:hypothetical protein T01_14744 [Trichinella spiralis]|uniref:Uncharacterized protein n=1 Tax=Trichinella spiralis TaxID=6334 RepID=A0A0V1AXG4_TRISP|nr:hypothetical protein T01_14744 [Trichinella spiralis]